MDPSADMPIRYPSMITTAHVPANPDCTSAPATPVHSVHASTTPVDPVSVEHDKPAPCLAVAQPICAPTLLVIHSPHDLLALHSGTSNPWGSLHYRNQRSYPLHRHPTQSRPDRVHLLPPQFNLCSQLRLPAESQPPVHIFQIIQHPHGISPTKPKITKTIPSTPTASKTTKKFPITTTKIPKKLNTPCYACGNIIPMHIPDHGSWRSMDTRGGRFRRSRRRSRRFWIANEDVHCVWGGHL
jgi:hypothetical protein